MNNSIRLNFKFSLNEDFLVDPKILYRFSFDFLSDEVNNLNKRYS